MNSILSDIILRLAKGSDQTFFQERYRNECKKASEDYLCARKRCQIANGSLAGCWQRLGQLPLNQAERALAVRTAPSTIH